MKRVGLITCLHGRPELTRVFLEYYDRLRLTMPIDCVAFAASPEDSHWLTFEEVLRYPANSFTLSVPNSPRSDKWNAAAALLKEADINGVFIVGSDDFLCPAYVEAVLALAEEGHDYITPTGCYFYDLCDGLFGFGRFNRLGAGRYLSRRVLEACDYQPWKPGLDRNADYALGQVVNHIAPPHLINSEDLPILDVKTGNNIWSYERVRSGAVKWQDFKARTVFPGWLARHFPNLSYERLTNLPVET